MGLCSAVRIVFVEDNVARFLELAEHIDHGGLRRRDFLGADVAEHRDIVAQTLTSAFRECGKDFFLHAFGGTFERERQLRRIHFAHEALHVAGAQAGKILKREQFSTHRSRESGDFSLPFGP